MFKNIPEIIKIGVWGPPGAGKTTYIVMLQFSDDSDGWYVRPLGESAQELFVEGVELMRQKQEFVPPTAIGHPEFLRFEFEGPSGFLNRNKIIRVTLPEASGELYEYPNTEEAKTLVNNISKYNGILWLIDPEQIDNPIVDRKSYSRMIYEWLIILHNKQGGGRLNKHMAFCLTKMDLPNHVKYFDDPEEYCLNKLGDDVALFLEGFCFYEKVKFFSTSSIGFNPETGVSNVDLLNPGKLGRPANPIGLFKPFRWFLKVT